MTAAPERLVSKGLSTAGEVRRRGTLLATVAARDAVIAPISRYVSSDRRDLSDALDRALAWLCRSHDATGRHGSSKGYSLLHGWLPAYPETTGYVIGTLLDYAERSGGRPDLVERAREMGSWEVEIQQPDGGVMLGHVDTPPRRSIVFNTGMVLHGWLDLLEHGLPEYAEPAERACRFLVQNVTADGTWRPAVEYSRLPHTYNARVAWAMLRWGTRAGAESVLLAAARHLEWVLTRQRANGWFDACVFKAATNPSTHAIAYTLRGLLESHVIVNDPRYLAAVLHTSETLIRKLEVIGRLPAEWTADWRPAARHECVTGNAQLGGVWLRIFQITGDARYLNAGLKAVDLATSQQRRSRHDDVDGGVPGSVPVWGRYAPLQYPNWAAKFLADALMMREDALRVAA